MADYNCIDVSEHNGSINWYTVKDSGVDYALIRCGFGQDIESQDDKCFTDNITEALNADIKVGVYFYCYAKNAEMAAGEAAHCLRLIEPYKHQLSLPVFYDLEEDRCKDNIYEIYTTFEKILNEYGYNVGGYASQYWFDTCLQPVGMTYTWDAKWGNKKPDWEISIWQFSSTGRCPGIDGDVDLDIVYDTNMKPLIETPSDSEVNINVKIDAPENIKVNVNIERG